MTEINLEECEMEGTDCATHGEDCKEKRAAFETSAYARPRTSGRMPTPNPLEDRVIDYG